MPTSVIFTELERRGNRAEGLVFAIACAAEARRRRAVASARMHDDRECAARLIRATARVDQFIESRSSRSPCTCAVELTEDCASSASRSSLVGLAARGPASGRAAARAGTGCSGACGQSLSVGSAARASFVGHVSLVIGCGHHPCPGLDLRTRPRASCRFVTPADTRGKP